MNYKDEEQSVRIIASNFEDFVCEAYHAFQTLKGQELIDYLFEDFDVGQTSFFSRLTLTTLLEAYSYPERVLECAILAKQKYSELFKAQVRDLSLLSGQTMKSLAGLIVEAYNVLDYKNTEGDIEEEYRNELRTKIEKIS